MADGSSRVVHAALVAAYPVQHDKPFSYSTPFMAYPDG